MTKFVIGPDTALHIAERETVIAGEHQLLAPTLLRSQVLSLLYRAVRNKEITKKEADRRLDYLRALRVRLLGDRVLQNVAWKVADQLGWPDTHSMRSISRLHSFKPTHSSLWMQSSSVLRKASSRQRPSPRFGDRAQADMCHQRLMRPVADAHVIG